MDSKAISRVGLGFESRHCMDWESLPYDIHASDTLRSGAETVPDFALRRNRPWVTQSKCSSGPALLKREKVRRCS